MNCLNCDKEITSKSAKKFCSASCSASFTNRQRPIRSEESRLKTSLGMKSSEKVIEAAKINGLKRRKENGSYCFNECKICKKLILGKKTCSDECYRKLKAKEAKQRGLGGHTSKLKLFYLAKDGRSIYLQSSYEIKVAQELDANNIKWERPKPLKWLDKENIEHKYYPDFYLNDYDVYLDSKNDYLIKKDEEKISTVILQNKIQLIVLDKDNLTWNKVNNIISELSLSWFKASVLQAEDPQFEPE